MSFLATAWAEEAAPTADVYERMILMCMAARADHDGSGVWRSIPRLARACHCDDKTVQRRLKSMLERGLIGYGDQSRSAHIDKRYRPKVYDLLIPHEWFSPQQLALANQERAENGLPPLGPAARPPIGPAPARRLRSDCLAAAAAIPAPRAQGGLTVPPVDNSVQGGLSVRSRGDCQSGPGGTDSPPNQSFRNPSEKIRPSGARATRETVRVYMDMSEKHKNTIGGTALLDRPGAGGVQEPDGRTEDSLEKERGICGSPPEGSYSPPRPPRSGEDPLPGVTTPEEDPRRLEALSGPCGGAGVPGPRSGSVPGRDLAGVSVAGESVAGRVVSEVRVQAGLARLDCRPSQRARLVELVSSALAQGYELDRVRGFVLAKCRESTSRRMSYVLGAFSPEHVGDLVEAVPVPSPEVRAAQVAECAAQRQAEQHARQRQERDTVPVRVSPVEWVTDQQFRVLSPGERSILTSTAGRPDSELTTFERQRLHRIRARLGNTAPDGRGLREPGGSVKARHNRIKRYPV